jgi:predicted  nucleic acid-binding Zn-ribbon protein
MFWVLLLLGVAILGGLIAYLGDSVGRRVGRKHLRLFGLRPKTTGLVVAVLSGVLVALLTVGTVALLARSTVDDALRAQEIRSELNAVRKQFSATTAEYESTRRDLERAKLERETLTQDLENERAQLRLKQDELTNTTALNGRLNSKVGELEQERAQVNAQIATKTQELERLAAKSDLLEQQRVASSVRIRTLNAELVTLEGQRNGLNANLEALKTNVQTLNGKLSALGAQRDALSKRITELDASKAALEARVNSATQRQQQLESDLQRLDASRKTLQGDVNALSAAKQNLENSVARLEAQNSDLQRQLSQSETLLRDTQTQLAEATSGNILFRTGEMVLQTVVEGTNPDEVKTRLQGVLRQVNAIAQAKGAPRNKQVTIKPVNDLEPYVRAVLRTSTPNLIVVRSSRSVTQTGLEFPVEIGVFSNTTLYAAGQPITSRELSLLVGEASLSVSLENLAREAERQLREQNVPRENITPVADEDIQLAIQRLRGGTGTVWVAVAARQDVLPAGPVRLYLTMLR